MKHLRKLLDLDTHGCRWPVTINHEGSHLFCNEQQRENSSYCVEHHARARVPIVARPEKARAA